MQQLIVTANVMNKRSVVPPGLPDPTGIVGTVTKAFTFLGEEADSSEVPNGSMGTWYKDRDGYFYWGGALAVNNIPAMAPTAVAAPAPAPAGIGPDKKDWGFINYHIDQLWTESKGTNIKVAILDSGLNASLPDFATQKSNISYYNAFSQTAGANACGDDTGHGTDCAGILFGQGSSLWGVAPGIEFLVIKISDPSGALSNQAILNGLDMAMHADVHVISMSFGIGLIDGVPESQAYINSLHQKIIAAYNKNITLVASVSDGSLDSPVNVFPASFPECLSVGAVDDQNVQASNESDFLDLMAPGKNVFSLTQQSETAWGSSFATPFVAGVAALLKSIAVNKGKTLTNIQLFDILKRTANINVPDYNKSQYGWGIVNPVAALNLFDNS